MENMKVTGQRTKRCIPVAGWLLFLLGLFYAPAIMAQSTENDRIKVKVGRQLQSKDFAYATYRFPTFQNGTIYYNSGTTATGKFNYNFLLNEMHFTSKQGDTLALDNLYLVKYVAVGSTKFYYDPENKGFGEEIADFNTVKLLIKHKFNPSDREKGVAYGQYSNAAGTKSYSSISNSGQIQKLDINEYLVLAKKASYFLADQNNKFYAVSKANILKIFTKHKPAVEKYLKDNRPDLSKEADLKKLLSFCSQLT